MVASNFQFLKEHQPVLFELACNAEGYAYSDPQSAVVKLRAFAEYFVGFIYRELRLPTYGLNSFREKLDNAKFGDAVEKCVIEKLDLIRIKGNKGAHNKPVSIKEAIELVKEAYFLGAWIFISYQGGSVDQLPTYRDPEPITSDDKKLREDKQRLEQALNLKTTDLEKAKAQLEAAEQEQREAQEQIESLNLEVDQVKLAAMKEGGQRAVATYDFQPEATREKIRIEDAFAEYQLTAEQSELVCRLDKFLSSTTDKVFLLKGYAGTGKTFITKGLTEYFRAIGRNYVLAAPTGKASKVIAKKTQSLAYTLHKTIYSFKDIAEYREKDVDGSETYKFYAKLAVNELSVDTVYIVDESSMISDVYSEAEFFRFGTGHLLQDFLKFVNLDHNDHHKKVIFIGDDAQLPPVGMKFSPALDPGYLAREYGLETTGYELTEVVRQKADSGVMHNAVAMRKALKDDVFNQLDFDLGFPDLAHVEYQDLIACYMESCGGEINAESIVIAHSNADVAAYNKRIREEFFPSVPEISVGDKVMAVSNSNAYGFFISNGDFGRVRQVFGPPEQKTVVIRRKSQETGEVQEIRVPLQFRDVEVGFRDLDDNVHFFEAKIVDNLLHSDDPSLSSDENKALYVDFCIRHKYLRPGSLEFKETLRSDPYFNALRLKFGYAITCHKAQGSEWNHVFVKCKTNQSQLCAAYFRWLYTAITRTAKQLYLLEEPHIKLGGGIKVTISPGMTMFGRDEDLASKSNPKETPLSATTPVNDSIPKCSPAESTYGIPTANGFLNCLLSEVKRYVEPAGVDIHDIHHQQYQEAYFFTQGSDSARINLSYSGKRKITSVVEPQPSELGSKLLCLLNPLMGRVLTVNVNSIGAKEFQFDEPFLSDLHERLSPRAESSGIAIIDVEQKQYSQRYFFEKSGESVVVDIYYNKKKQFNSCNPVTNLCFSNTLLNEVLSLITEGLA